MYSGPGGARPRSGPASSLEVDVPTVLPKAYVLLALAGREGHCSLVLGDELDFAQEAGRRHQTCLVGHCDLAQAVPGSPGRGMPSSALAMDNSPFPNTSKLVQEAAMSCVPGVPRTAMRPSQTMTSLSVVGPGTVTSVSAPLR